MFSWAGFAHQVLAWWSDRLWLPSTVIAFSQWLERRKREEQAKEEIVNKRAFEESTQEPRRTAYHTI